MREKFSLDRFDDWIEEKTRIYFAEGKKESDLDQIQQLKLNLEKQNASEENKINTQMSSLL